MTRLHVALCLLALASATGSLSWTRTAPALTAQELVDVAFGNNIYILVGQGQDGGRDAPVGFVSSDAETWTEVTIPSSPSDYTGNVNILFVQERGMFYVFDNNGTLWTTTNGQAWSVAIGNVGLNLDYNHVIYGNGVFIGYTWTSLLVFSSDGRTWIDITPFAGGDGAATFANGYLWAYQTAQPAGPVMYYKQVEGGWIAYNITYATNQCRLVITQGNGGTLVAAMADIYGGVTWISQLYSSTDGVTWSPLAVFGYWDRFMVLDGVYMYMNYTGTIMASTDNGNSFNKYAALDPYPYYSLVYTGKTFFALGGFGLVLTTDDFVGGSWQQLPEGVEGFLNDMTTYATRFVIASSLGTFVSFDGAGWNQTSSLVVGSFFQEGGYLYGVDGTTQNKVYQTMGSNFASYVTFTIAPQQPNEVFVNVQFAGGYFFYTGAVTTQVDFHPRVVTRQYYAESLNGPWTVVYDSGAMGGSFPVPVAFGAGVYLRVAAGLLQSFVPTDRAHAWANAGVDNSYTDILYHGGLFFAASGSSGNWTWQVSDDGTSWAPIKFPIENPVVCASGYPNVPYYAVGDNGGVASSTDGHKWSSAGRAPTDQPLVALRTLAGIVLAGDGLSEVFRGSSQ